MLALVRNRRKQLRVHDRLKLLVGRLEMKIYVRAVRIHAGIVHRQFLGRGRTHLFISKPAFTKEANVAALIESDDTTVRSKFTPPLKLIV